MMNRKIIWACVLLSLVSGGLVYPQDAVNLADDGLQEFEKKLEQLRQELKIPGMSAAIVKNRTTIWTKGFGYNDEEKGVAMRPETPFRIDSLTKTFTAALVMRLAQEGKINLDRPVKDYGLEKKNADKITVRHLLSHTSEYIPGTYYHTGGCLTLSATPRGNVLEIC